MIGGVSVDPNIEPGRMEAVRRYHILDTPPDGSFDRVTALAARLFNVPIAIVSIVDTDRIWFKSHHGLEVDQVDRDPGLCASAILHDGPWLGEDAHTDPHALANPLVAGELGLGFYLGIPLTTSDGYNLGTLCVLDVVPRRVSEREVADLTDLAAIVVDQLELRRAAADKISVVAEQRRHAEEFARTLQEVLLPAALPDIPAVKLVARYLPAHRERVGGDFYDAIDTEAGVMLLIGDVSGHGPEAATLTSMARHTLRIFAKRHWTPARSLSELNRAILDAQVAYRETRFCTVAAARLDHTEAGCSLTVSLGGHPHPLLLHADGTTEPLGRPGPLVGLFEDVEYEDAVSDVVPGDTLVLYTDGLTDAAPGVPNPYDGSLQRILAGVGGQPADVVADALLDAVRRSASRPRDDIAILVARIVHPGPP